MDADAILSFLVSRRQTQTNPSPVQLKSLIEVCLATDPTLAISKQDERHWFCSKQKDEVVTKVATYLIYLFSYNRTGQVGEWVKALEKVVLRCERCARGFCSARVEFRSTYITQFPDSIQQGFLKALDDWQSILSLSTLSTPSTTPTASSISSESILSLPSPTLQLVFGTATVTRCENIRTRIISAIEQLDRTSGEKVIDGIVELGLTTGLLSLIALEENPTVRKWAAVHIKACRSCPLSMKEWKSLDFPMLWNDIVRRPCDGLTSEEQDEEQVNRWSAVSNVLESGSLSEEVVRCGVLDLDEVADGKKKKSKEGRSLIIDVAGLLTKTGPVFPILLKILLFLIKTVPSRFIWSADPSPEFPLVVFGDIKNNATFQSLVVAALSSTSGQATLNVELETSLSNLDLTTSRDLSWVTSWLSVFLKSVKDVEDNLPSEMAKPDLGTCFGEMLARVFNFWGEELQHSRFEQKVRAKAMSIGMKTLSEVYTDLGPQERHSRAAVDATLNTNSSVITGVALNAKDYPRPLWDEARASALYLLAAVFQSDGEYVRDKIYRMGSAAIKARTRGTDGGEVFSDTRIHDQLWTRTYNTMSATDHQALVVLLRGLVRFAHLATPEGSGWSSEGLDFWQESGQWTLKVNHLRKGLDVMKGEFANKANTFAAINDLSKTKKLWDTERMPEIFMRTLLSPDPRLHDGVMAIVTETFTDISMRIDCFRAVFEYYPVPAIKGMQDFLKRWNEDVGALPAATESAMWLVRCLTDILECFCRQGGTNGAGFLREASFLRQKTGHGTIRDELLKLWQQMALTLATIFKLTPQWAQYYENEEMVAWMTDALIFGRTMVEEIRTFEAAASDEEDLDRRQSNQASPSITSSVGNKMTAALEGVLLNVIPWLRLTDLETLHQTFELMKLLLHRLSRSIPPQGPSEGLRQACSTLDAFCRRAKGHKTKLGESQLSELAEQLQPFISGLEEDAEDDEIEFLSARKLVKGVSSESTRTKPPAKDAFKHLMSRAEKLNSKERAASRATPSKASTSRTSSSPKLKSSSPQVVDVDEFDMDDPFSGMSNVDLARLERGAQTKRPPPVLAKHVSSTAPQLPFKPIPKPISSTSGIVGKIRQDKMREKNNAMVNALSMSRFAQRGQMPVRDLIARPRSPSVDSGSSASSSSDDEDTGLAALERLQQSPARLKRLQPLAPVRPQHNAMSKAAIDRDRQRQNAQRIKNRLKPDLTDFFRTILGWDSDSRSPTLRDELPVMPHSFRNATHFRDVITPLFFEEVWTHSLQAFEESADQEKVMATITAKYRTDDFLDIECNVAGRLPDRWIVNEQDLLLFKPSAAPIPANSKPTVIFAKVQMVKRMGPNINIGLRMLRDTPELQMGKKWTMQKHMGLSTEVREFAALRGMEFYEDNMVADILGAKPAKLPEIPEATVQRAMLAYNANEPQAKAIIAAYRATGFVLIQGPPGTGKTKTISGLVGRFLSQRSSSLSADQTGNKAVAAKLLICAPSNAAIDEVTRRLKDGVPTGVGTSTRPKIVRIGADASTHVSVKDVHLDVLVNARLTNTSRNGDDRQGEAVLQERINENQRQNANTQAELDAVGDNQAKRDALQQRLVQLKGQRTALFQERSKARDAAKDATRQMDAARRQARQDILNEADIICSTLSGAGHESIAGFDFETVIIDEAAQAVELSALIPLKYRCTRCIMIGDPNQLPPTVMSQVATQKRYDQSLFVRMQKSRPEAVHLLSIQYRMHPDISMLPSDAFYDHRLTDGPDMAALTLAPWHKDPEFGPYRFFSVPGAEAPGRGHSMINNGEVNAVMALYRKMKAEYGVGDSLFGKIGVISMYREQVGLLRNRFRQTFGEGCMDDIDFNTVDGFQGQEKSIIIVSCVRSGVHLSSIGFLADERRMNVALTRAKSSLFVFGNAETLERCNVKWKMIVGNARDRGFFIQYNGTTFTGSASTSTSGPTSLPPPGPSAPYSTKPIKQKPSPIPGLIPLGKPKPPPRPVLPPPKPPAPKGKEPKSRTIDVVDLEDGEIDERPSKRAKLTLNGTSERPQPSKHSAPRPSAPTGKGPLRRPRSPSSEGSVATTISSDDEGDGLDFFIKPGPRPSKTVPQSEKAMKPKEIITKTKTEMKGDLSAVGPRSTPGPSNGVPSGRSAQARPGSAAIPIAIPGEVVSRPVPPPRAPPPPGRPPPPPPANRPQGSQAKKNDASVLFINKKKKKR